MSSLQQFSFFFFSQPTNIVEEGKNSFFLQSMYYSETLVINLLWLIILIVSHRRKGISRTRTSLVRLKVIYATLQIYWKTTYFKKNSITKKTFCRNLQKLDFPGF